MSTRVKKYYDTVLTPAITSAQSLASDTSAGLLVACSVAVDNTSALAVGYEIAATFTYPNSAPTDANLYLYLAEYDGSAWTDDGYGDAADGTDQTITIGSPTVLRPLGVLPVLQNKVARKRFVVWDPAVKFCVVAHNGSGQTLSASGHSLRVTPLYYDSV